MYSPHLQGDNYCVQSYWYRAASVAVPKRYHCTAEYVNEWAQSSAGAEVQDHKEPMWRHMFRMPWITCGGISNPTFPPFIYDGTSTMAPLAILVFVTSKEKKEEKAEAINWLPAELFSLKFQYVLLGPIRLQILQQALTHWPHAPFPPPHPIPLWNPSPFPNNGRNAQGILDVFGGLGHDEVHYQTVAAIRQITYRGYSNLAENMRGAWLLNSNPVKEGAKSPPYTFGCAPKYGRKFALYDSPVSWRLNENVFI